MNSSRTPALPQTCQRCGCALAAGSTGGFCTPCMLNAALDSIAEEDHEKSAASNLLKRRQLGGYELLDEIARGGMGVVFRARQRRPDRQVALKVIAAGELASPRMIQRFQGETEAVARLDHANIASIYEVGQEDGWHYFSMRLIEGPTLANYQNGKALPPRRAAELLVKVARAVHHAHQRGVLHRDLKPNNILLDTTGEPILTDFGLAKILEADSSLTLSQAVLGTPAYMSPEQASGDTKDATVAADIYGLGAVLYEMLTGQPPFSAANTPLLLRKIVEDDPQPPSAFRKTRAKESGNDPGSTSGELNRDLEIICLKCLEKQPDRRYLSAAELADDLARALRGEPIQAHPSTAPQRARKWVRRNPAKAALIGTTALALLVLTALSLAFNIRLTRARDAARASDAESRRRLLSEYLRENGQLNATRDSFRGLLPLIKALQAQPEDLLIRQKIQERITTPMQVSPRLIRVWDAKGQPAQAQFSADGRYLVTTLRSGAARAWDLRTGEALASPDPASRTLQSPGVISPDGLHVLQFFNTAPRAGIWDIRQGTVQPLDLDSDTGGVGAFSPHGKWVATGGRRIRMWNATTGAAIPLSIVHNNPCIWLTFSPDGKILFSGEENDRAWQWDATTGELLDDEPMTVWRRLAPRFSSDGRWMLLAGIGHVEVRPYATRELAASVSLTGVLFDMNLSPNGRQFVTAAFGGQARVWDTATGNLWGSPIAHESGVYKALFSPDGLLLATAGFDQRVGLVRASDLRPVAPAVQRAAMVETLAFSPDGRFLATGDSDGVMQIWDLETPAKPLVTEGEMMFGMGPCPDTAWVLLHNERDVYGHNLITGESTRFSIPPARFFTFDFTGRFLAAALGQNGAQLWDFRSGRLLQAVTSADVVTNELTNIAVKPDGSEFVTATHGGVLQRWSAATGQPLGVPMKCLAEPLFLNWSSDGRWICSGAVRTVEVWDAQTDRTVGTPIQGGSREALVGAEFSPDAKRLALSFKNDSIDPAAAQLYELPSLKPAGLPMRHGDGLLCQAFSSDGSLIATGGEDNVARVWRAADGTPVTGALRHDGSVMSLAFRPDGRLLATGSADGGVRLWDIERGELIAPPWQMSGALHALFFTPDGRKLCVIVGERYVVWTIEFPTHELSLRTLEQLAQCKTGISLRGAPGGSPLSASELESLFSELQVGKAIDLSWPEDLSDWHRQRAELAERDGDWFAAAFHWERLAEKQGSSEKTRARLENARAWLK